MGSIALLGMIVLLVMTLYIKMKYHIWRFSHKFMVLVFVFAILHSLLISSDISRDMFLRYYILFFALVGLSFGAYRAFLRYFFNRDFEFKVIGLDKLNNQVTEIEIEPKGKKVEFHPGQFIFIRFVEVGVSSEPHPFSVTSARNENNLKIVVKALGDYTKTIGNLRLGAIAKIEGPFGHFYKNQNSSVPGADSIGNAGEMKKEVWIAGGVGITPFLSLARSLPNTMHNIYLFYCLNDVSEAVFAEELNNIARASSKFHVVMWYSKEKGRINADIIEDLVEGVSEADIYICGPLPFMRSLKDQFVKKGVEKSNINFEEFNFL